MNNLQNLGTFEVSITETLQRKVLVEATDADEAERIAREAYSRSEYVLGADNFTGTDFRVSESTKHNEVDAMSGKTSYRYYSTRRPVSIGTFPKNASGPERIVNFDTRESVESGLFQAWGYLEYPEPLTEKQIEDYELTAAPGTDN